MSLTILPDIVLIKIFRTLNHTELVYLYQSFHSSKRLQNLIHYSPCLWTHIHIKLTVNYHLFTSFSRLLISNASTTRQLIIDELDLTCRKILYDNGFSLKKFSQLEQLIISDEHIGNTLQSLSFCSSTLQILRLMNDQININQMNNLNQLNFLQTTLYSINLLQNRFDQLKQLHLKIMFDYDHNSHQIFSQLPIQSLQTFVLRFMLLNNDLNFVHQLNQYLNSCSFLHTLELSYLHTMCPLTSHTHLNYSKYQRLILINICQLKQMKEFIELNHYELPLDYLQSNSTLSLNQDQYSSYIQYENWNRKQLISIRYMQCVTTSMELFNEFNMIWSDKNQKTQSFESYILRSIHNTDHLISSLRNLIINKFELSLDGLVTLLTRLPLLTDLIIEDGKFDQMGSGIWDLVKIFPVTTNELQSTIRTLTMNNIQMSRRTVVKLCLITRQLLTLTMDNVRILDRTTILDKNGSNLRQSFLVFLKQIAQSTDQFKWAHLESLTLGKHMINGYNLLACIPSHMNMTYAMNIKHLRFIIHDRTVFELSEMFLKAIKNLIKLYPKLTSLIIEWTKRFEEQSRLQEQLYTLLKSNMNKKVHIYSTKDDRAYRFCFDTDFDDDDDDDDDQMCSSRQYRKFCGIPLFQLLKQRK